MKIFSDFSLEVRVSIMPNRTKRFEDFELLVMFEKKSSNNALSIRLNGRKLNNTWSPFLEISANRNIVFSLVPATISTNLHNTSSLPKRLNPW